ncbi:hypothetical protein AVEN_226275-1 [Araneus ventricosus]|uniref:Uncharacterized protein n=1 Tax=Araneus ventricosus TaxID=182803 RepID=A0A4Y2DAM4_ARAVE|nr:hypothetical protein AVEN_226275-1 [Araneus ventricosus]
MSEGGRSRSSLSSNTLSPTAYRQRSYSSLREPSSSKDDSSRKYTASCLRDNRHLYSTSIQICQEISRREVQIDQNLEYAQNCRKAINDPQNNGSNEALISSRNHELKNVSNEDR